MKIKLLCFGITKDLLGGFEHEVVLEEKATVKDLKTTLMEQNKDLGNLLSLRVAINQTYAEDYQEITENDEVVLIPPVSGG
jgi:molybdopterin converting factor small subunit